MYSFPDLDPDCFSMSHYNSCFLTCIQISQKAGTLAWYPHLLKNFPQFAEIYTVKGIGKINTAEVDIFREFPCLFYDLIFGNLISDSSAFYKSSLNILEFLVHVLLKPCLEKFQHYFASVWDEHSFAVVWIFFGIALFWDWTENWPSDWKKFSMECYSVIKKNTFESGLMRWMNLDPIIHSEESQKAKYWSGVSLSSPKYCILMHICSI